METAAGLDASIYHLALTAALFFGAGAVGGVVAGLVGVGGGLMIPPLIFFALDLAAYDPAAGFHVVVATSLAVVAPIAFRAWRRLGAAGAAAAWRIAAPAAAIGAALGAGLAAALSGGALTLVVSGLLFAAAIELAFAARAVVPRAARPGAPTAIFALVGVFAAFAGVGAGALARPVLMNPALPHAPLSRRDAVATAAALGAVAALVGGLVLAGLGWAAPGRPPLTLGYVHLAGAALMAAAMALAAPFGAKAAATTDPAIIRWGFAALLALCSLMMASDALDG